MILLKQSPSPLLVFGRRGVFRAFFISRQSCNYNHMKTLISLASIQKKTQRRKINLTILSQSTQHYFSDPKKVSLKIGITDVPVTCWSTVMYILQKTTNAISNEDIKDLLKSQFISQLSSCAMAFNLSVFLFSFLFAVKLDCDISISSWYDNLG